jgi:subfamily B ATP-binding cassette protein MsbA
MNKLARRNPPTVWFVGVRRAFRLFPAADRRTARLLADLLARYRSCAVLTIMASILVSLFESGSMAVLAVAVQFFLAGNPTGALERLGPVGDLLHPLINQCGQDVVGLALLIVAVLSQLLRCLMQFSSEALGVCLTAGLLTDLRRRLFRRFMAMSYEHFGMHKLGELAGYYDQADRVGAFLRQAVALVTQLFVSAGFIVVLLWLSWSMTLQALGLIAVLFWPIFAMLSRVRRSARRELKARVRVSERLIEYLAAFRVIQTFGLQKYIAERFDADLQAAARSFRRGALLNVSVRPCSEAVTYLAGCSLLLALFCLNSQSDMVVPSLIGFTLVLYRLIPHLSHVNNLLPGIAGGWPVVRSVAELLPEQGRRVATGDAPPDGCCITFRNVSFSYQEGQQALRAVTFSIPPGKMTAIVGRSGAGKSTVLNLLLRLCQPSQGAITVNGTDLGDVDPNLWRARIGLVDQDGFLFHASVCENIRLGKVDASDARVRQAAGAAGADEFIRELAGGYDTVVGDRGQRLSGGQRQRLAIARALVRDPQILILDEGTSSLDAESELRIQRALWQLRAERTVICITHRLCTVTEADQIVVLERGEVVECGTHQTLLKIGGYYSRLWHLQAGTDKPPRGPESTNGLGALAPKSGTTEQ